MIVRLRVTSPPPRGLLATWIAARGEASSQIEDASTEAEAQAVQAWKSIDQLS
jgi:hypothetical protein